MEKRMFLNDIKPWCFEGIVKEDVYNIEYIIKNNLIFVLLVKINKNIYRIKWPSQSSTS